MLILQGERLRLRDFLPDDAEAYLALEGDGAMFAYTKGRVDRTSAKSVDTLAALLQQPHLNPRHDFHLVVEDGEGFSGYAGMESSPGSHHAEVGWYLRSDRWGRGYATGATRLLLDFGFSVLHKTMIWATADPENVASMRVLEKSGLTNRGPADPVQTWLGMRPRLLFTIEADQWRSP